MLNLPAQLTVVTGWLTEDVIIRTTVNEHWQQPPDDLAPAHQPQMSHPVCFLTACDLSRMLHAFHTSSNS